MYNGLPKTITIIAIIFFLIYITVFVFQSKQIEPRKSSIDKAVDAFPQNLTADVIDHRSNRPNPILTNTDCNLSSCSHFTDKEQGGLSHIVIPFTLNEHQFDRITTSFKYWERYLPCDVDQLDSSYVNLIILLYRIPDQMLAHMLEEIIIKLSDKVKGCFHKIEIINLDLPPESDNHYSGSRLMFETLIDNSINLTSPKYIFWMEPDVIPIRESWLKGLQQATLGARFWIKGSAIRVKVAKKTLIDKRGSFFPHHINGCAIYNMQPNEYPQFYQQHIRTYLKQVKGRTEAFDSLLNQFMDDGDSRFSFW